MSNAKQLESTRVDSERVRLKVWGAFACFTRPEFKVERMSYPVMTPSAARGALEAVYFKPEFHWVIHAISVLKPIKFMAFRRNEVSQRMSPKSKGILADACREQRNALILKDVGYVIEAAIAMDGYDPSRPQNNFAKHRSIFLERAAKGQCHFRPYLGTREFSAFFGLDDGTSEPIQDSADFGMMLYDLEYRTDENNRSLGAECVCFFRARLEHGVMKTDPQAVVRREEVQR
jgi:CRISPR-associated protein Cas5d